MSSAGQFIGGIAGAVIGFFASGMTGMGAVYGAQIGMGIGGMIDPPPGPNLIGPRLSDLSVQTSTYGENIPRIYGTFATHGNVIWLEKNKLKEVVKEEDQGGKGGGGGSTLTTYSYFATFAVGLCKGPISGVRRIWIGSKLVYDVDQPAKTQKVKFKVYNGTDTQLPDPRMQADRGVADTPAYRGLAYIVFYDYPLKDHGNSLIGAPVKVEVVSDGALSYSAALTDLWAANNFSAFGMVYNPVKNEIWVVGNDPTGLTRVNADTGVVAGVITAPGACAAAVRYNKPRKQVMCAASAGIYVFDAWSAKYLYTLSHRANDHTFIIDNRAQDELYYIADPTTGLPEFDVGGVWVTAGSTAAVGTDGTVKRLHPETGEVLEQHLVGVAPTRMVSDKSGRIWMLRNVTGGVKLSMFVPNQGVTEEYAQGYTSTYNDAIVYDPDRNSIWLKSNVSGVAKGLYEFDIATRTYGPLITLPYQWTGVGYNESMAYDEARKILWVGGYAGYLMGVNTATRAVEYALSTGTGYGIYEHADVVVVGGRVYTIDWGQYLMGVNPVVLTENSVTLDEIVSAEALQSKQLAPSDINVTGLASQVVRGFRVSNTGAIRAAIEPLRGAWPFDVVQSGYVVKFIPRGTSPVASVTETELDARGSDESPGVRFGLSREMDTQLPRRLTLKYVDRNREYDIGEQSFERLQTTSDNVREVDMSIVFVADEAAQIAERLLYLQWLERIQSEPFRLPPTRLGLEPGDVINVTTSDATHRLHLQSVQYMGDGRLECQAKLDLPSVYSPMAQGEEGDSTGAVLTLEGLTRAAYLDIPTIRETENTPGFVAAVTGYLPAWPGGVLFSSSDLGQSWSEVQATAAPGANIGIALTSIGAGRTDILDTASVLQVEVSQALASITQTQLFSGSNLFAYGKDGRWEIIGAQTCTLQGDGSWIMTNLMRGRYGTEWAMTQHAVGDTVVALNPTGLSFVPSETAAIGLSRLYLAITAGDTLDSDIPTEFTYRGVNLECLSPVYLNGNRDPTTNDWALTWVRRTRVGGEWRDYVDAMLGQSSESYEIDIFADGTYATVKRTLTSATSSVAYTSAQQVTDFGSNQATLYVRIYQMSDVVGRGYPLQASITR